MKEQVKCKQNILVLVVLIILFFSYSLYVYTKGTSAPGTGRVMSMEAYQGKLLWQDYNCTSCHQLYGLGGFMGPDLTNVISVKGEAYTQAFIMAGSAVMPKFDFSEKQVKSLIAYLKYVDSTGNFPAHNAMLTWYGSFELKSKEK